MKQEEIIQGKNYLKKCIMVLRSAEGLAALLPLIGRLIKEGIGCEVILSEELPERAASPVKQKGVLYLTDDSQVYARLAADALAEEEALRREYEGSCQPSVLIYLHSGNQGEDFADARYALEEPEAVETEYLERVYRRCHNLPWEILTTERCWLRETIETDVDQFWRMYLAPEITRYTERLFPTLEAERGYIREYRRQIYPFYEFGVWTVLDRSSGTVVGRAGLSVRDGCDLPELGFVISEEWQGRGLATEVCRGILKYARESLGFSRIQALVHEDNAGSLHLCRKLGFTEAPAPFNAADGGQVDAAARTAAAAGRLEDCLVEMEQNGQPARFVYMVYEGES